MFAVLSYYGGTEVRKLVRNTSPQHQGDRRADNVTMVLISAETRNSFTLPQFNFIGWLAHQLTLAFQEEHFCGIAKGENKLFASIWSGVFSTSRNSIIYEFLRMSVSGKMATKELISPLAMATDLFSLKSACQLIC